MKIKSKSYRPVFFLALALYQICASGSRVRRRAGMGRLVANETPRWVCRMEGKALEGTLAGKLPREGVRMKDDSGRWHVIRTPDGKRALAKMLLRAEAVKAELARV